MDITNYVKAGYPGIVVNTQEPYRAINSIKAEGWETYAWDCLQGITHPATNRIIEDVIDPLGALNWLKERSESVFDRSELPPLPRFGRGHPGYPE